MIWLGVIFAILTAVPVFLWAYARHLDVLTGPWIAREMSGEKMQFRDLTEC